MMMTVPKVDILPIRCALFCFLFRQEGMVAPATVKMFESHWFCGVTGEKGPGR